MYKCLDLLLLLHTDPAIEKVSANIIATIILKNSEFRGFKKSFKLKDKASL